MSEFATQPTAAEPPSVRRACYTTPGLARAQNEDACALPPPGADEARFGTLLAVADGVGGMQGGAAASREAVEYLQALYYANVGADHRGDRLRECVEAINSLNRLGLRRQGLDQGRLTTLVAAVVEGEHIWIANVGDSRAYLIQASARQRHKLTEDHSGHARRVKAGLASDEETAPNLDSSITRAIGLDEECQVDIYHYGWSAGDCLVLCSDGLAALEAEEMVEITLGHSARVAARDLVARAVEVDGSDNCTAIVACWEQGAPAADPTAPVLARAGEQKSAAFSTPPAGATPMHTEAGPELRHSGLRHSEPRRNSLRRRWLDLQGVAAPLVAGVILGLVSAALLMIYLWSVYVR